MFFLTAALKLLGPPTFRGPGPWLHIEMVFVPVEVAMGWAMLRPGRLRCVAALLGATLTAGRMLLITAAVLYGRNVHGCRCLGPFSLPYGPHMLFCGMLLAACVSTVRAEERRQRAEAFFARVFD